MEQTEIVKTFVADSKYYMVKYRNKSPEEFGKIIDGKELQTINLTTDEIHRSIECANKDTLFMFNLLPKEENSLSLNPLSLLIKNIGEMRTIETIYPNIFRWTFDGISIKAMAIIPSGNIYANTTLTRYGGTDMFIRILRQHLKNIAKLHKGLTPDYNFLSNIEPIEETVLSIGSLNTFNNLHCITIEPKMSYVDILKNSNKNINVELFLNTIDMKYWSREINPDFITEAKHIKLDDFIPIDETLAIYPACIRNLMSLKKKGNYNRFLLAKYLLSIHRARDAKFIYDLVMASEELEHIKLGNCSTQWRYVTNNIKKYSCPTCNQMKMFCDRKCTQIHPLETIYKQQEKPKNGK